MPAQLRARLEASLRRHGIKLVPILAGKGKEGILWLLPHPREVKPLLLAYADGLPQYGDARIIILPYVELPADLLDDINVLVEAGAQVTWATSGGGPWPVLPSNRDFDEQFRERLFRVLTRLLLPDADAAPEDLPSTHLACVCGRTRNLLLAGTVLRRCDTVTEDRYQFMRDAADAFEALLRGDPGISLEEFFGARGLEHAQSGGITAKVTVMKDGRQAYVASTQTHLKRGDATTKASAARIYYHRFAIGNDTYIAVLHAGPHPDRDVDVVITIGPASSA
ncbi:MULTISPECIES: hypothetical protein [unclassified Rubrivivax]|uniref:hypothetical protein n=1 Tax=unclassified Rubrivivax TaxID=2649762 RepID=UPI001E4BE634|nr:MULTISPECIES: hypothetical protein [unclassified Rubrivivax]MCC9597951.1 hypothetical protein [Rubrivivax sp. JA1055]MCC9645792.1 hypothetical protein [Rubrivivax sp. JA1029]